MKKRGKKGADGWVLGLIGGLFLLIAGIALVSLGILGPLGQSQEEVTDAAESGAKSLSELLTLKDQDFTTLSDQDAEGVLGLLETQTDCEQYEKVFDDLGREESTQKVRTQEVRAFKGKISCIAKNPTIINRCQEAEKEIEELDEYLEEKYKPLGPEDVYVVVAQCYAGLGEPGRLKAIALYNQFLGLTEQRGTEENPRPAIENAIARLREDDIDRIIDLPKLQEQYSQAVDHYLGGEYAEAEKIFDAIISTYGGSKNIAKSPTKGNFVASAYYLKGRQHLDKTEQRTVQICDTAREGFGQIILFTQQYETTQIQGAQSGLKVPGEPENAAAQALFDLATCYKEAERLDIAVESYELLLTDFKGTTQYRTILNPESEETIIPNCEEIQTSTACHQKNDRFLISLPGNLQKQFRCVYNDKDQCESCAGYDVCSDYSTANACSINPCKISGCEEDRLFAADFEIGDTPIAFGYYRGCVEQATP